MDANPNSKELFLANLLLKLHHDEMTGVVTVKDNRRALRIYLQRGHIVSAEGIDKEIPLLKEIGAKRNLTDAQKQELRDVLEKDPQSLGRVLIEKKIINRAVWSKFLELKVKAVLAAAFDMDHAEVGFSKTNLDTPSINFIDYNILQLLLDTLRGIEILDRLKARIPDDNTAFALSPDSESLLAAIPLSPMEQRVLSMVDGQRTVRQIMQTGGLDPLSVYKNLYLLICFGLIRVVRKGKEEEAGADYSEIINLYLDLLGIIETHYRKEVGREFENVFRKCKEELTGQSRELFQDVVLFKDHHAQAREEISRRFTSQSKAAEGRLVLLSSFNKLLFLLVMRMKKLLGLGLAEKTLNEMMNILGYVEKYRQDTEVMNYVKENLKDYLKQLKS
ncbi:MAG: hypothetical protein JXL84_00905 [Deltaproteobacteria bacterium]|nr:hypothetical protein [Deltaproteobacteria bacterium]